MCAEREDDPISDNLFVSRPLEEESLAINKLYTKGLNPLKVYYDFYVEKLVGYIPADLLILDNPVSDKNFQMRPTNKNKEDLSKLLASVFDTFKEMGVKYIETDLSKRDHAIFEFAERYGFDFVEDEHSIGRLMTENVKIPEKYRTWNGISESLTARNINLEESFLLNPHRADLKDRVVDFILDKENISRRSLNAFFEFIQKSPNRIASHSIFEHNDEIIGHSLTVRTRWDPNIGMMSFVNTKDHDDVELREILIGKTVLECKLTHINMIEINIREDVFELSQRFTPNGFKFRNILSFESII